MSDKCEHGRANYGKECTFCTISDLKRALEESGKRARAAEREEDEAKEERDAALKALEESRGMDLDCEGGCTACAGCFNRMSVHLQAERDAALAQVATLREVLEGTLTPSPENGAMHESGCMALLGDYRCKCGHTLETLNSTADASRAYVARVRNAALEEAAKHLESKQTYALPPSGWEDGHAAGWQGAIETLRALASRTEPKDTP